MLFRTLTIVSLAVAAVLILGFPWFLGLAPGPGAPLAARRAFAIEMLGYVGVLLVSLIGAGIGAAHVVRTARRQFRDAAARNLRRLIEGGENDDG